MGIPISGQMLTLGIETQILADDDMVELDRYNEKGGFVGLTVSSVKTFSGLWQEDGHETLALYSDPSTPEYVGIGVFQPKMKPRLKFIDYKTYRLEGTLLM